MKKEQFRELVKEIIKEVMTETNENMDNTPDDRDEPVDMTGIKPTAKADKKWRGKMRTLDKIKSEPDFKSKLNVVQRKNDVEPALPPSALK